MGKRWRVLPHDAALIRRLERSAGVSPVVAQLLVCRGVTDVDSARLFLDAKLTQLRDPELLPGVPAAVDLLSDAIAAGRKIIVYGDYDADGMTGAAILLRGLQLLGAQVGYHVPNRLEEGYGLNSVALAKLRERGAEVIVSVDCGIASLAEADEARRLGLQLIVTDHHELAERLPNADVLVHPRLPGGNYPFGGLSGSGVAFKLAWALARRASGGPKVGDRLRDYLLSAIALAAIGSVADVVPLVDENRVLVRHGLVSLQDRPPLGLAKLLALTGLDQKRELSSEDISFTLAPRLNAAGRLGQAQLGIELLSTDSAERAAALAEYIHHLNDSRTSLERSIYLAASKQAQEECDLDNDPALVLAGRGWHPGVIGIVAARLADKHHRPVVLLSLDEVGVKLAGGSARTAGGVNLFQALSACREHLAAFGGHAAAAGLKVEEARIDAFRAAFFEAVSDLWTDADRTAELVIDAEAPLSQLSHAVVSDLERLAPFGQANPRPLLCATGVELVGAPKRIGGGERHLSLRLKQHGVELRCVGFGHGEAADELASLCGRLDVAYRPVINDFRGRQTVELQLVDWRPSISLAAVDS